MNNYLSLTNRENLIDGVVLKKLVIHKDESGSLIETLRTDWLDVCNNQDEPFAMQYLSITPSGVARDEDVWHVHENQIDRFVCISGRIVTALYDNRNDSKTKNLLNLFAMGPKKEEEMYMLIIPKKVYHGFMVVSEKEAYLLNSPTNLYTGEDEGRVPHQENFKWQDIRGDFNLKP